MAAVPERVGGRVQSGGSLDEAFDREGLTGRGSALLEVWDISGKASAEQQQSSFPLSASSYPSTEKRQCQEKKHVPEIFPEEGSLRDCTLLSLVKDYSIKY